jgi:hypothetical protein
VGAPVSTGTTAPAGTPRHAGLIPVGISAGTLPVVMLAPSLVSPSAP